MSTTDPGNPLWSERQGGTLPLTDEGFATLLVDAFDDLKARGCFRETMRLDADLLGPYSSRDPARAFFSMKLGDPWAADALGSVSRIRYADDDRIFDVIELLHRDVVSEPTEDSFDREAGRARLRDRINPILARRDPPLELTDGGEIVQRVQEPFRRLVEQALPEDVPQKEVTDRVNDAIAHFRRRSATPGDRRAAVRELADVLEYLRKDVKENMLREDEGALFRLANEFAIRHNKRETRRDFDEPAWLSWAFYVYLASIRLTLYLRDRPPAA